MIKKKQTWRSSLFDFNFFQYFRRPTHVRIENASLAPTAAVNYSTSSPPLGSCGGGPASTSAGRYIRLGVCGRLSVALRSVLYGCEAMHFASLTVVAPRVFSSHCGDFLIGMVAGFSFGEDFECFQWEWRCWWLCSFLTGAFARIRFLSRASPWGA